MHMKLSYILGVVHLFVPAPHARVGKAHDAAPAYIPHSRLCIGLAQMLLARAVVSMHFAAACPRAFYVSSRPLFPVATLLCCRPAAARARYVLVVVWSLATSANEAKPRPED